MRLKRKRFSIISKLKLFARRDEFPDSLRKEFGKIINEGKSKRYNKVRIHVIPSDEFKRQYKQSTNQARIDKLVDKLQSDPETWFDNGDDKFADTHYLKDYSSKSDGYVMFSKKINNEDRLNYRIYKPVIQIDDDTEEIMYYQKIVLDTCLDHTIGGKPGSYVKGQTGNTWHSSSKAAKRKRKLLKQNKKDDLN